MGDSYGLTQYSSPATVSPATLPGKPQSVTSAAVSDTEMRVSFTSPLRDGSSPITEYEVEWDTHVALKEKQVIDVSSTSTISGFFSLAFEGHTTGKIEWDSSAEDLKLILQRLPMVGMVSVSRANAASNGFKWTVTFDTNVGNRKMSVFETC